jgi:hypothetical protein
MPLTKSQTPKRPTMMATAKGFYRYHTTSETALTDAATLGDCRDLVENNKSMGNEDDLRFLISD